MRLVLEASEPVLTAALSSREALLAEMGVAMREDGGTLGVFSPKKVGAGPCANVAKWHYHGWMPKEGGGVMGEGVAGWNSGPGMNQPFLDFALRGDILVAE